MLKSENGSVTIDGDICTVCADFEFIVHAVRQSFMTTWEMPESEADRLKDSILTFAREEQEAPISSVDMTALRDVLESEGEL